MPSDPENGAPTLPAKIVLIEDDPRMTEILATSLAEDGITVEGARDGREALHLIGTINCELILLDLGLPELDGFGVLEQLKQTPSTANIPVIVLTAWHGTKDKLRGFELGAVDYITKPFELVELRARVRATLRTKRLQDQLTQANRRLEAARAAAEEGGRAKAEFLANMSHEIRTPMNGVIAMTGILLQTELTPEQQDFVETIRTSGESLLTIINDILNFSKIESGKMELEHRPLDLDVCIEDALDLLASKAVEKNLDLSCRFGAQTPRQVRGDVTRLRQVLVNLIGNAIKFTAAGEVAVDVQAQPMAGMPRCIAAADFDPAAPGDWWEFQFSVRDTGIGIPADRINRLFQSFSQVDSSTTRQFGGTGLGLAISKGLVELMGGRMWVDSTLGEGTTFHFALPLQAAPSKTSTLFKPQPPLVGLRALVVDDHSSSRGIVAECARQWGMVAQEAGTPREALQYVQQPGGYDVVLIDAVMPEMDGSALAAEIRMVPRYRSVPLIFLSAAGLRTDTALGNGSPFSASLSKPIKPTQLRKILVETLSGAKPVEQRVAPTSKMDASLAARIPLRILLTDDNVINQKVASRLLLQMGYRADLANNGAEALRALERQPYDIIFMDVQMPEMDGLEATRRIRQREQDPGAHPNFSKPVVIIAMTANAMQGDREKCLAAGMNDYIPKPVRPEVLQATIEKLAPVTPNVVASAPTPSPAAASPATAKVASAVSAQEISAKIGNGPVQGNEGEVIDRDRLLEFAGGSFDNLSELINLYLNQTSEQLDQIRAAIQVGSPDKVARVAHSCAGASATCGMLSIVPPLRQLERLGTTGNLTSAPDHLASVAKEFDRIKNLLERFPEPLSATDSKP